MILGIVGHEAAKFTPDTESIAKKAIYNLLCGKDITKVVSGACHLGGIDRWAIDEARRLMAFEIEEFPSVTRRWDGPGGYKERNIKIATVADRLVCIVVRHLPGSYMGPRFEYCYHCKSDSHIKSGGCWTLLYARQLGKPVEWVEI
jgi:hypothetical protein